MLRSMYSGISGMRGFQTKLDVIGNNIANVNTTGFKAGRVMFKDMLSQTVAGSAAPTANVGGINPRQIGLGSAISSIDTIHTQGSAQTTNVPTDLMINGEGFFEVRNGTQTFYTRAGNFALDAGAGAPLMRNLVTPGGLKVQGEAYTITQNGTGGTAAATTTTPPAFGNIVIPASAESFKIDEKGTVTFVENGTAYTAGIIKVVTFQNPGGLLKSGENLYTVSPNSGAPSANLNAANANVNVAGVAGRGSLIVGALEMSNVDLSNEFTEMIVAQRGFQANTKIITTSDEILQELVNLKR